MMPIFNPGLCPFSVRGEPTPLLTWLGLVGYNTLPT
jgi:hypothetical protein